MVAGPVPPPPPPPIAWTPQPPPPARPEDVTRWRAETQATVAQVRSEVQAARIAGVRGSGWLWLGMGASVGVIDLVGTGQGLLGSYPDGLSLLGQLYLPVMFAAFGLTQLLFPGAFPLVRRSDRRSLRNLFGDAAAESPLGSALAELEGLRKELRRSDVSSSLTGVGGFLGVLGGLLLAAFTVTSVQRALSTGAPLYVPVVDIAMAASGTVVIALSLWRIWRAAGEIHGLSRRLTRFEWRLWELQTTFWSRF